MRILNTQSQYGWVSRALHWIIVLAIVAEWLLAEAGEDSQLTGGFDSMSLHQSIGLTVLLLAVIRLAWRFANPRPAWPSDMKPYEINIARAVHAAFYVLLFAIPLTGWALSSAEGEPVRYFNWFVAPPIAFSGADALEDLHETLFNVLVALALLHALGALKHWIVRWTHHGSGRRSDVSAI